MLRWWGTIAARRGRSAAASCSSARPPCWPAGVAGAASDDDGEGDATTTATTTPDPSICPAIPSRSGVASGDPLPDSVILWTRLALDPLADDGLGGHARPSRSTSRGRSPPTTPSPTWWRAAPPSPSPPTPTPCTSTPTGSSPATDYHYRFTVGDHVSPVGRTRTLPDGSPERFGLARRELPVVRGRHLRRLPPPARRGRSTSCCTSATTSTSTPARRGRRARHAAHPRSVESLADYRLRYASLPAGRGPPQRPRPLPVRAHVGRPRGGQQLHGRRARADRRRGARRPSARRPPTRRGGSTCRCASARPTDGELAIYQAVDVGDLARICVLDQRQYSDPPPCRDDVERRLRRLRRAHDGRPGPPRRRAGGVARRRPGRPARRTWNLIGNPVVLAGIDGGNDADGSAYYLDTWDGFPTARHRLIEQLATVDNPVVLTGDYHAGMVLDVARAAVRGQPPGRPRVHGAADLVAALPRRRQRPHPAAHPAAQRPRLPHRRRRARPTWRSRSACSTTSKTPPRPSPPRPPTGSNAGSPAAVAT